MLSSGARNNLHSSGREHFSLPSIDLIISVTSETPYATLLPTHRKYNVFG